MARMSQSASSCGLASWMRPQQLQHFYDSGHSFAKIAIPYTIYLSLNLLAILAISVVLQICFDKKEIDKTIYPQKTSP